MKIRYSALFTLHLLTGLGALAGGFAAITDPQSPMGMPVSLLEGSPFSNYFIPGVFLFAVLGVGNILCAGFMNYFKTKYQGYLSIFFGCALMLFLIIQVIVLNDIVFLHVLFFVIGLIQAFLSYRLLVRYQLFPANAVHQFFHFVLNNRKKTP